MKSGGIPAPAVRRLSLYLRQLEAFQQDGQTTVSSKQLGEPLDLTDAQVRKDLAYFGQFGHPGVGYRVDDLIARVRRILGTDRQWNVALVGAGNLGRALAAYRGFSKKGFKIVAVFDADPAKIGKSIPGFDDVVIQSMTELAEAARTHDIRLAVMAVPADSAQSVAEELIAAGIRGVLNFAPVSLQLADEVAVGTVDLAVHLEQLSFQLSSGS